MWLTRKTSLTSDLQNSIYERTYAGTNYIALNSLNNTAEKRLSVCTVLKNSS